MTGLYTCTSQNTQLYAAFSVAFTELSLGYSGKGQPSSCTFRWIVKAMY